MKIDYPPLGAGKKAASSADGRNILTFVNAAFRDYLAARVLLLSGLTVQGAVLASTAIEKYLKAVLEFRGNRSKGHLKRAHINAFKNYSPAFYATFNEEFFLFLQRIYALRYPDALKAGFNAVIARREFIAELDHTAIRLNGSFQPTVRGTRSSTLLDQFLAQKDPRLLDDNHVLGSVEKQAFISAEPQVVYEMRITAGGAFLEVEYLARPSPSDGRFCREGLRLGSKSGEVFTAFEPMPRSEDPDQQNPSAV